MILRHDKLLVGKAVEHAVMPSITSYSVRKKLKLGPNPFHALI